MTLLVQRRPAIEAASAFGDATVFLEEAVIDLRPISMQRCGTRSGRMWSRLQLASAISCVGTVEFLLDHRGRHVSSR
jgi:hypothetical protein